MGLRGGLHLDNRGNWWWLTELYIVDRFVSGAGGRRRGRGRGPTGGKVQVSIVLGGAIRRGPVRNVFVLCGGANELQLLLLSLHKNQNWMDNKSD